MESSLDQVKMEKKIYSRRRLESRVCKFRIYVKNRLVLIAQAYTYTLAHKFWCFDFQED